MIEESQESAVDERTAKLRQANIRLIEQIAQRERAEEALVKSQAVGQIGRAMAHDFSNVLAAMAGYVNIIRLKSGDPQVRALADKALAAADRGGRLAARLLALARPDWPLNHAVDVQRLVRGIEDWLRQTVGNQVHLHLSLGDEALVAVTDTSQLELALLNLVINARDAMPDGGELAIDLRSRSLGDPDGDLPAGDYVVVTVRDSGNGMAPEVLAKAFDPFFTTKAHGRGSGLGLAQVRHLARLSGGAVRISSCPGEGTRVALWLQAGTVDDLQAAQGDAGFDTGGNGENILVVDDDDDVRNSLAQLLAESGYCVRVAADGNQALTALAEGLPDLLILDFAMPGLTGVDVAGRVRHQWPELPVLFVSGYADLEAIASGTPLLRKPFDPGDLFAAVKRGLMSRQSPQPQAG